MQETNRTLGENRGLTAQEEESRRMNRRDARAANLFKYEQNRPSNVSTNSAFEPPLKPSTEINSIHRPGAHPTR